MGNTDLLLPSDLDLTLPQSVPTHASLWAAGQKSVAPDMPAKFATAAHQKMRAERGGYRRDHVCTLPPGNEMAPLSLAQ